MEVTPAESMFLMQDWMKLCAAEQRGAIRFWLENDPSPSWRRLIVGLDEIGVHVEANEAGEKIRKYTEPLEGMCTKVCVVRKLGPHLSGVGEASLSALLPVRFPTWPIYPKYLCNPDLENKMHWQSKCANMGGGWSPGF